MAWVLLGAGVARAAGPTATVSLSPPVIPADGSSQSTVTVALSPPLTGQTITLSVSPPDAGISFSPVHDNGDGTYTATLTSSRNAEVTQVFAADPNVISAVYPATLTQLGPSATSLAATSNQQVSAANPPVTNQEVVLTALVNSLAANLIAPVGTVSFDNAGSPIAGCQAIPIAAQPGTSVTVPCGASFSAGASPASVTAVFSPTAGSLVGGSTSAVDSFPIERDSTSTLLGTASRLAVGLPVTYLASVSPAHAGVVAPSGSVRFTDNGRTIRGCAQKQVNSAGTADCTVTYRTSGSHLVTASYAGDDAFAGSTSGPLAASVQPIGTIAASMQWKFFYTTGYTQVLQLTVNRAPVGSTVSISCRGHGCRLTERRATIRASRRCRARRRRSCGAGRTLHLASWLAGSRLRPRARFTVAITRPGWIGKGYAFLVRAGAAPAVQIGCVAPGRHRVTGRC